MNKRGKKRKYSEQDIREILKEYETGTPAVELQESYGISSSTFYRWKELFGPREPKLEPRNTITLEAENRILKEEIKRLTKVIDKYRKQYRECQVQAEVMRERMEHRH